MLIVGTIHDLATPYAGALVAQRNLVGSRLLTYQGYGHPAAGQTVCTDNAISNYVLGCAAQPGCQPAAAPSPFSANAGAGGTGGAVTKAARVEGVTDAGQDVPRPAELTTSMVDVAPHTSGATSLCASVVSTVVLPS